MKPFKLHKQLMLVTQKNQMPIADYLQQLQPYLQAGVTCVQLREKHLSEKEMIVFAQELKSFLNPYSIPLIINDDIATAQMVDADGVHLGQGDGCVMQARKSLGPDKIIGLTVNSLNQVQQANALPIDYIGVGAIFPTNNKSNIQTIWGLDGLQQVMCVSKGLVIAIGGIDLTNIWPVLQTKLHGIAAISLFLENSDKIKAITKEYLDG